MKENLLLRVVGYAFSLLTLLSCATEPTQRESFLLLSGKSFFEGVDRE